MSREMWLGVPVLNAGVRLDTLISFMDSTLNNFLLWLSCAAHRNLVAKQRIWQHMQVVISRWECVSLSKMLNTLMQERERERMFTYNEKANLASCQKGHNTWREINASKEVTYSWFMTDLELTLSFRIFFKKIKITKTKQSSVHRKLCEWNFSPICSSPTLQFCIQDFWIFWRNMNISETCVFYYTTILVDFFAIVVVWAFFWVTGLFYLVDY